MKHGEILKSLCLKSRHPQFDAIFGPDAPAICRWPREPNCRCNQCQVAFEFLEAIKLSKGVNNGQNNIN